MTSLLSCTTEKKSDREIDEGGKRTLYQLMKSPSFNQQLVNEKYNNIV